ncbi:hypothetical protein GCM10023169_13570 [Georgenia halophila]|uniref:DUF4190 domain-containing protein n=2 Tax=Georgenia halophila TaxID=620889 RepID=A0ABP8L1N6_9MICO
MRLVRVFGLALLITVALSLMAPPWPVPIVTAVVAVGSLVLGIVALVRVRSAKVRGATPAVLAVGLVVAAFMALTMSGQIVLWREYSAYSECMDSAITQQAQDGCLAEFENSLQERMDEMQQMMQTG